MSGLAILLWCKGYINLSSSNSGFFLNMKTLKAFIFSHLQLRFLHLHIYMQNVNLCTRDPDKKRYRFRRSLEDVLWQFCSVTAPPSTKLMLQPWGITVPCQCYSCTFNCIPALVSKAKTGTGICWTPVTWCWCLLHYQKITLLSLTKSWHCYYTQFRKTSLSLFYLLSLSLLSCTDTHSKLWSIWSSYKIKF